jgi:AcrR family transcriptional regulator
MTTRLTRTDWLNHGLAVLAGSGPQSLKAEPLAKSLNVSRGSFYWHFRNIAQFHGDLLDHWRKLRTEEIIADIDQTADPANRLRQLMRRAITREDPLERAIRSWAAQDWSVADAVALVDRIRLDYLAGLLVKAGIPAHKAQARAAFIYWANLGRNMMTKGPRSLAATEIDEIAELMQS